MKQVEVAAGILWRGERYLAVRRPPGAVQAGWWEFPGGKLEAGETPQQALCRELREELSVHVEEAAFWRTVEHVYTEPAPRKVRLHFFHVRRFGGEPNPNDGQTLRWVRPDEAASLSFLEADVPLVNALCGLSDSI